jgi:hypothetical protein
MAHLRYSELGVRHDLNQPSPTPKQRLHRRGPALNQQVSTDQIWQTRKMLDAFDPKPENEASMSLRNGPRRGLLRLEGGFLELITRHSRLCFLLD